MTELNRDERYSFQAAIPATLVRQIRALAIMEDRDLGDVVACALLQYLGSHSSVEGCGNQFLGDPLAGQGHSVQGLGTPCVVCATCRGQGFLKPGPRGLTAT